jgi:hypothetical protein
MFSVIVHLVDESVAYLFQRSVGRKKGRLTARQILVKASSPQHSLRFWKSTGGGRASVMGVRGVRGLGSADQADCIQVVVIKRAMYWVPALLRCRSARPVLLVRPQQCSHRDRNTPLGSRGLHSHIRRRSASRPTASHRKARGKPGPVRKDGESTTSPAAYSAPAGRTFAATPDARRRRASDWATGAAA